MDSYEGIEKKVITAIKRAGFTLAANALKPLRQLDFAKLVTIHDHEEHFLRTTFIYSLIALKRGQARGPSQVTAKDVETAMQMLGVAAALQTEQTISKNSKSIIKSSCPFCVR